MQWDKKRLKGERGRIASEEIAIQGNSSHLSLAREVFFFLPPSFPSRLFSTKCMVIIFFYASVEIEFCV